MVSGLMSTALMMASADILAASNLDDSNQAATANQTALTASASKKSTQVGADIASTLRDNSDQVWLTPAQGDAFLLLFKTHEHRQHHGTVLLLADNHQHANWPGLFRHLRTQLPTQGWATIAISLPSFDREPTPSADPPTVVNTPPSAAPSDLALSAYIKNSQVRFEHAQQYLQERALPGKLVVIAFGLSATAFLGAVQQGYPTSKWDGLILMDGYQPFPDAKIDIRNETIKLVAAKPVQDIFQTQHPYYMQMQQRQLSAKQHKSANYFADALPTTFRRVDLRFSEPQLIFIEKRISNWLKSVFIDKSLFIGEKPTDE